MFGIIHWACPGNAMYGLIVIPVLFLLAYRFIRSQRVIHLLTTSGQYQFLQNSSLVKIIIRSTLWFLGFIFICLSLMRPQWNKKEDTVIQEGRDLFIALDISRSMLAQDVLPNRLEFAKDKIRKLVHSLSSERVGLILFSSSPFVQCPLTSDFQAFFMFLDQVDNQTISSGTTAIDQAIAQALQAFKTVENKNKLLVLVTDGEDFSHNLQQLKKEAQEQGLIIFTLGIGTSQGAPVPLYDHEGKQIGHQKDNNGSVVISRLHDDVLRSLATDLGGTYMHASQGNEDIQTLVQRVEKIEKAKIAEKKISSYEDHYHIFLLISFIALCLEWII